MSNSIGRIDAGAVGNFSVNLLPAGAVPAPGQVAAFASDSTLAVVTPAADGLSCSVAVDPTAKVGGVFNLSWSLKNADGTVAATATPLPVTITGPSAPPPPPPPVSGADLIQTS